MAEWNPNLYLKFGNERTQPSLDLIARIAIANPTHIIDLGCGPGNSTKALKMRWHTARVVGLDNSPEMIAAAQKADPAGIWQMADVATWQTETAYDIVFSNATLQWVKNHADLMPKLLNQVAPGGALAVQMPETSGIGMPIRQIVAEVAALPIWQSQLAAAKDSTRTERPAFYYNILRPLCKQLDLWETEYNHVLDNVGAIIEWFKATMLRPYLDLLSPNQHESFFAEIHARASKIYPPLYDGKVILPFRRVFFIAYP
jgi:trans-aconitate 2-methyltransferase